MLCLLHNDSSKSKQYAYFYMILSLCFNIVYNNYRSNNLSLHDMSAKKTGVNYFERLLELILEKF